MDKHIIYFDEEQHKYTDELSNTYIPVTTLKAKYFPKFDTKKMAKICSQRGNIRYQGMTAKQIEKLWDKDCDEGLVKGNMKHGHVENSVDKANGVDVIKSKLGKKNRLYTIDDILSGELKPLNLSILQQTELYVRYPKLYNAIKNLSELGYAIYSEVSIFMFEYLICGTADLVLIKDGRFLVFDWKTYKNIPKKEAGYYKRGDDGLYTKNFVRTYNMCYEPISHLEASVIEECNIQCSLYAKGLEDRGLVCDGLVLGHLYTEKDNMGNTIFDDVIFSPLVYRKKEVISMIKHYTTKSYKNNQFILSLWI